jgi:peptide/nickel transport system permease protein
MTDRHLVEKGAMSQWELTRLRFSRHRLAVASLLVLIVLYTMALFAEFLAPTTPNERNYDYMWCPPQIPRFSLGEGFYVHGRVNKTNPVTLETYYLEDPDVRVPLGFFVKGEPYRFWGLFKWDRHFFGVRKEAFDPPPGSDVQPVWFFLGSDRYGHDLLSRLIYGSRISLSIGLIAISLTFVLGLLLGGISGYAGGRTDLVIQRLIEIINAFPALPLWLALAAILPPTWGPLTVYFMITVILSALGWTGLARVVRGKILALREEEYAVAARLMGASHGRIIFRHLLPGFTSHIVVSLTLSIPGMILGETSLSFLGLGLRPPIVSWGVLLQDCLDLQVVASYPWLLMPVFMIIITVFAFNYMGDGIRDAADPYSSS